MPGAFAGYQTVGLEAALGPRQHLPARSVIITFADGYRDYARLRAADPGALATFGEPKLSAYTNDFPRWRYARTVLLQLSDRWPGLPRTITRVVQVLERTYLGGIERVHVRILDYLYWAGGRQALRERPHLRALPWPAGHPGGKLWA